MKKLLLIFILIFGTLTYSACEFPKEILKDSLASTTYNEIKAIGYESNIYCDQYGDTMLYYMEKRNDLQVGFYFNVESIENYIDRTTYYNKVNKMLKKIAKSHKGSTITVRSFYISQKGTYAMTVTKLDEKGKITSYANEKLRNTVHFPETNYTSYRYTSDIIW